MQARMQQTKSGYFIELSGRLDMLSADEMRDYLSSRVKDFSGCLVVDLHMVDYMDSGALAVLIGMERQLKQHHGKMVLVSPSGPARKIFSLIRSDQFFTMSWSIDEALAAL